MPLEVWDWDQIKCGTDGKVVTAHNKIDGKWYCGMSGPGWDRACGQYKGCGVTYNPPGAGNGGCEGFPGKPLDSPWISTYPKPEPPAVVVQVTTGTGTTNTGNTGTKAIDEVSTKRNPSKREGNKWGSWGGRE